MGGGEMTKALVPYSDFNRHDRWWVAVMATAAMSNRMELHNLRPYIRLFRPCYNSDTN